MCGARCRACGGLSQRGLLAMVSASTPKKREELQRTCSAVPEGVNEELRVGKVAGVLGLGLRLRVRDVLTGSVLA